MAAEGRRKDTPVKRRLFGEPHCFEFFQAVRLLERCFQEAASEGKRHRLFPVGDDHDPSEEVVRFRALQASSFQPSVVSKLEPGSADNEPAAPPEMSVSFLGLTGPSGALPQHYTRLVIELLRAKDGGMRDFLDAFNHRLLSLFYRAWEKYRFPTAYERARVEGHDDRFTSALFCLVGLGTGGLRGRFPVDDEFFLGFAGLFADTHRSGVSLGRLLANYFDVPARIETFLGRWLPLGLEHRTALCGAGDPRHGNSFLGCTTVLGARVWDVESKFRVHVGPLTYRRYLDFLPAGKALRVLGELVQTYVGLDLDFDVQVALLAAEVPACTLDRSADDGLGRRLGWNSWLRSRPIERDFDGAVFASTADSR